MIRKMTIEDYDGVKALWLSIKGFAIRSLDDSREGVARFLSRNPDTSVVAVEDGRIVGAILCGHDGRRGCLYHVCVAEDWRMRGIGKAMVVFCMEALKAEQINKVSLIALTKNDIGNAFWKQIGWTKREDLNYYDFTLNEANITAFNGYISPAESPGSDPPIQSDRLPSRKSSLHSRFLPSPPRHRYGTHQNGEAAACPPHSCAGL